MAPANHWRVLEIVLTNGSLKMPTYKAPLHDMHFLMNEVFDYPAHYKSLPNGQEVDPETVTAILEECARYSEEILAPLNESGDKEGCHFEDGKVTTPKGFKAAYDQYVEAGWQGLTHPEQYGGQGLPTSLGLIKSEMLGSANWSFSMYPGLSLGAMNTIMQHASEELKNIYMPPLTEGRWGGTMCLTEPQCGTDLGQVSRTASRWYLQNYRNQNFHLSWRARPDRKHRACSFGAPAGSAERYARYLAIYSA